MGTTHTRGGTAEVVERALATVTDVTGADDVCLWQARGTTDDDPPGTVEALDLPGAAGWRLAVVRETPLDAAESRRLGTLADLVAHALAAEADSELASRLADLVDATLLQLDAMIGATVEERLVKVARDLAEVLDAKSWSVRLLADESWVIVSEESRRGRLADPLVAWAPYDPRALELDEGSMAVRPDDGPTPVTEALRSCDLSSLVGAIGYDPDAVSWTLCMVGDAVSGDLTPGRTALAALVPAALGFPSPPRAGGLLRTAG